jgi:hypothetical protein
MIQIEENLVLKLKDKFGRQIIEDLKPIREKIISSKEIYMYIDMLKIIDKYVELNTKKDLPKKPVSKPKVIKDEKQERNTKTETTKDNSFKFNWND